MKVTTEAGKHMMKEIKESLRPAYVGYIYDRHKHAFYFEDEGKWIAVDNTMGSFSVEEFDTEEEAKKYDEEAMFNQMNYQPW